jgi:hypothetical protein
MRFYIYLLFQYDILLEYLNRSQSDDQRQERLKLIHWIYSWLPNEIPLICHNVYECGPPHASMEEMRDWCNRYHSWHYRPNLWSAPPVRAEHSRRTVKHPIIINSLGYLCRRCKDFVVEDYRNYKR